jgi:hypothetical protein
MRWLLVDHLDRAFLKPFAGKYIWWKTPDEAVTMPERVIAQVMNIGDYTDVQRVANHMGDAVLRDVITHAQAGQFDARSWAYWHYRLGLAELDQVPPLPQRSFLKTAPSEIAIAPRLDVPDITEDGVLHVASLDDLMATKVKVILQRAEAKDYRDIAAMVGAGVSLAKGLSAARTLYGNNFQPSESLKAMVYFDDGDLRTLTPGERTSLTRAVREVRDLPAVTVMGYGLTATSGRHVKPPTAMTP